MKKIQKIIRKIPVVADFSKIFYDWRKENKLQKRIKAFIKSGKLPFSKKAPVEYRLAYEPTIRCNLKCKMCYQGQTRALRREELSTADSFKIFEKLKDKVKTIKLIGGEPTVRDDIFEIISYWDKAGKKIILHSNFTLLDDKKIEILKNFKGVKDALTSIDGPKEIHDAVRGVQGSFDKMKKAIASMKEKMPDASITVFAMMLISDNLRALKDLIDIAKEIGIGTINVLFEQVYSAEDKEKAQKIFKSIFGWNESEYRLNTQIRNPVFPQGIDAQKIKQELAEIRLYGMEKGCFVNFVPFNYYKNLDKYLGLKKTKTFCLKLLSPELRVNQTGDVIWCDVIEKSFGNLLDKTPDEIWLSPEYQKFREYLFKNSLPICNRCCKASYLK